MDKKQLHWTIKGVPSSTARRRARSITIQQTAERERLLHDLLSEVFEAVRGERR